MGRLIVNGNQVYEIDEECIKRKKQRQTDDSNQNTGDDRNQKNKQNKNTPK